jgi:hypothetical protein
MENVLSDDPMLELQIDSSSGESLEGASWWARFNSIIFAICLGILTLVLLFAMNSSVWNQLEERFGIPVSAAASAVWIILIVILAVFGLLIGFLMAFANKTTRGVRQLNQEDLESGINSLKIYFIIYGILGILGLLFNVLDLIN